MSDGTWVAVGGAALCCLSGLGLSFIVRGVGRPPKPVVGHGRRNGHRPTWRPSFPLTNAERRRLAHNEPYDPEDIARRDHRICYLCGLWVHPDDQTMDHLVPLVRGGTDTPWNVRLAHRSCNSAKGGRLLIDMIRD